MKASPDHEHPHRRSFLRTAASVAPAALLLSGCGKKDEGGDGNGGGNPADRLTSKNNLSQVGAALHFFHHDYNRFPPAASSTRDGKSLLSWRVFILPYLDEKALHDQFKLDEPWDGEHNKKLLDKIPKVYAPSGGKGGYLTYVQGFNGPGALFEYSYERMKGLSFQGIHPNTVNYSFKVMLNPGSIPTGASNFLIVVESGPPVPWTKPDDIPYDPAKPLPELGGVYKDGFFGLMADRTVKFFKKGVAEAMLRRTIDRRNAAVIDWSELEK